MPPKEKKFRGYFHIARHYKWALNHMFFEDNYDSVIIIEGKTLPLVAIMKTSSQSNKAKNIWLEASLNVYSTHRVDASLLFFELKLICCLLFSDDLDISVDFFEYFAATHSLLKADPTLWCVSAWNDNGEHFYCSCLLSGVNAINLYWHYFYWQYQIASYFFCEGLYSQKIKTLKNFKIKNKENKISHGRGHINWQYWVCAISNLLSLFESIVDVLANNNLELIELHEMMGKESFVLLERSIVDDIFVQFWSQQYFQVHHFLVQKINLLILAIIKKSFSINRVNWLYWILFVLIHL